MNLKVHHHVHRSLSLDLPSYFFHKSSTKILYVFIVFTMQGNAHLILLYFNNHILNWTFENIVAVIVHKAAFTGVK
jgi:hypothetical protein